MVFSGGLMIPFRRQGNPHIFLKRLNDIQMPIDRTGHRFAPTQNQQLRHHLPR
jgi:hypothetical protein